MIDFQCIGISEARRLMADNTTRIVDIRDPQSFADGHIPGAEPLNDRNADTFVAEADPHCAVIVCCYHGHSSQAAAAWLVEQGFTRVYSLDGGFEGWRQSEAAASGGADADVSPL